MGGAGGGAWDAYQLSVTVGVGLKLMPQLLSIRCEYIIILLYIIAQLQVAQH